MSKHSTCPICNAAVTANARFCTHCGTDVTSAETLVDPVTGERPTVDTGWQVVFDLLREATRGRFEIERELGHGGMAAVYLAHEKSLDRKVALKVMSPGVLMQEGMVDRFRLEAITIAGLKHPNIVTVHGVEHHGQLHFFVLEFVEGRSLEHVIKTSGPLPLDLIKAWMAQVGSALEYAHRRGVVHRDIKPANILIDIDGNAIVTDFGIAKVDAKPGQTATGTVIGTPAYMSPEQCLGQEVTGASDQYSLGVVAYEMLTGAPPFDGPTFPVMQAHAVEEPPPILERRPDCPPSIVAAVDRMLAKEPDQRWSSISDCISALKASAPAPGHPLQTQMAALARSEAATEILSSPATPETAVPIGTRVPDTTTRRRSALVPTMWASGTVVAVALAILLGGPWLKSRLSGNADGPGSGQAATLVVSPSPVALAVADSSALEVTASDSSGTILMDRTVSWTSSDSSVATVRAGFVVGLADGLATVTAHVDEVMQPIAVSVSSAPAVATVSLNPDPVRLEPGGSARMQVTVVQSDGGLLPGREAAWRSENEQIATVGPDGVVRARGVGTTTVSADVLGVVGEATVRVEATSPRDRPAPLATIRVTPPALDLEPGEAIVLTAEPLDTRGTVRRSDAVSWVTSDSEVASVEPDGRVIAVQPGRAVVTARTGAVSTQVEVTVRAAPVVSVSLVPESASLAVGDSVSLAPSVMTATGQVADPDVTWRSTNPGVADVEPDGTVSGVSAGTAIVTASSGTVMAQATIEVNAAAAVTLSVAAEWSDRFVDQFVTDLNAAMSRRDVDAVKAAYRVPVSEEDATQWQTLLENDDFNDFEAEATATFEPEQVGGIWRTDFEVTIRFRHSRGSDAWEQSYRMEFRNTPGGLVVQSLGLRAQRS